MKKQSKYVSPEADASGVVHYTDDEHDVEFAPKFSPKTVLT